MSARDLTTRCVCGHLVFIHVDEDRRVEIGDEPQYGAVYEHRGTCLHAGCACRDPRAATEDGTDAPRSEAAA